MRLASTQSIFQSPHSPLPAFFLLPILGPLSHCSKTSSSSFTGCFGEPVKDHFMSPCEPKLAETSFLMETGEEEEKARMC